MISLFTWNDTFLTHLPSVDAQHQRLVALINDFGEYVIASDVIDPQTYAMMRNAVLDYARDHFSDEESQIKKAGLDSRHLERQQGEHRSFLEEAMKLGENIQLEQVSELVEYLVRWLAYHILGVDQSMARQIRAIESGQDPKDAFENDSRYVTSGTDPLLAALRGLFYVVSERNRELKILNRDLEDRVAQRTVDLEHANQQLQLLSTLDELTGLPNRRFSNLSMKQLWLESRRYGNSLSVLLLDADKFKAVNDNFGHAHGDALLQSLGGMLRDTIRSSDIVCRLGGDEFLVICPHTSQAGAADVGRKILATIQPFYSTDGTESWSGSLSIGIAEAGANMAGPGELLLAADNALYTAKRQGGATFACHESS